MGVGLELSSSHSEWSFFYSGTTRSRLFQVPSFFSPPGGRRPAKQMKLCSLWHCQRLMGYVTHALAKPWDTQRDWYAKFISCFVSSLISYLIQSYNSHQCWCLMCFRFTFLATVIFRSSWIKRTWSNQVNQRGSRSISVWPTRGKGVSSHTPHLDEIAGVAILGSMCVDAAPTLRKIMRYKTYRHVPNVQLPSFPLLLFTTRKHSSFYPESFIWRKCQMWILLNLTNQHQSLIWSLLRNLHESLCNDLLRFVKFDYRVHLFFILSCALHLICILRNDVPQVPLVHKTNNKILQLIQAIDTSMLVAQLGYRLSSDAASMCDPFTPSTITTATSNGSKYFSGLSVSEVLRTMAAHGRGHCLKALETFRDVQQRIYRVRH